MKKKFRNKIAFIFIVIGFCFIAGCTDKEVKEPVGILRIEKTGSEGNNDFYTITYTDGTTFVFTITNGNNGVTPHIGENGNWWIGTTDTKIKVTGKDGAVGKDGEDGFTPYIGENGNWWIGTTDTKIKAAGKDGETGENGKDGLTPFIGENGNWWIGTTDTKIKAAGKDGETGEDGKDGLTPFIGENGNWWIGDYDTKVRAHLNFPFSYNIATTQNSITFDYDFDDYMGYYNVESIELYQGQNYIEKLTNFSNKKFENLLSNTTYTIKLNLLYNATQNLVVTMTTKTQEKQTPEVFINDVLHTKQKGLSFNIDISDIDATGEIKKIELYQNNQLIESFSDLSKRSLTNLAANRDYVLKVIYAYDLNDGKGEQTLSFSKAVKRGFEDGDGTYNNPFLITNAQQLISIGEILDSGSAELEGKYFCLKNNIDLSGIEWNPIGTQENPFSGYFLGENHIISGLTISQNNVYNGLFGYAENLDINNLWLENIDINITENAGFAIYAGGLAGFADESQNSAKNISVSGEIKLLLDFDERIYVGGIIGYCNSLIIDNCDSQVNIEGKANLSTFSGGIVGRGFNIVMTNTYNTGSIKSETVKDWNYCGGLIGAGVSVIDYSYNTGKVISKGGVLAFAGGLIGSSGVEVTIRNSYNTGNVFAGNIYPYAGGLIGGGSLVTVENCYNSGEIEALGTTNIAFAGGIISRGFTASVIEITNTENSGNIIAQCSNSRVYIGGLIGYCYDTEMTSITSSSNSGDVTVNNFYYEAQVGGLIGFGRTSAGFSAEINNSFNTGDITSGDRAGGLVSCASVKISESYNSGKVTGTNRSGGIIGYGYLTEVEKSYNTGEIYSVSCAGGIIARSEKITINECFNTAEITGDYSGGLIGEGGFSGGVAVINNSYNNGFISGKFAGGLMGKSSDASITKSYNIGRVSGLIYSGGIIGDASKTGFYFCLSIDKLGQADEIFASGSLNTYNSCYYYSNYNAGIYEATRITSLSTLDSASFYLNNLEFDSSLWNFDDLDVGNDIYPALKNI